MMRAVQSPLFEPVLWHDGGFRILDEIQVPQKLEYIEVTEVAQALAAVREMKTRAFGQVLTYLYSAALVAQSYSRPDAAPLRAQLKELTQRFCDARPTFDFRGLGGLVDDLFEKLPADSHVGIAIAQQSREFGQKIVRGRKARAKRAAELLPSPARLLTHCNVSGELVEVAAYCRELGKELSVIATETRPYLQGARLTAWELAQAGVPVELIPDCAVAQVMAQGAVNAIIVGADRTAQNGDVINKVGTYSIACMARQYGVPFYALVQDPRSLQRGKDVPIEERPAQELLTFSGKSLVPGNTEALAARYPSFDVTPSTLITHLIGFDGLYTPASFREKYQRQSPEESAETRPSEKYLLLYGVPPKNQYAFLHETLRGLRAESLLVPEMRPHLAGVRTVARELLDREIPATIIADDMIGALCAQGEIAKLLFFHQGLADAGARGICGSRFAVQLARLHGVPVEILDGAQLDGLLVDDDVATFLGRRICPDGVAIRPLEPEIVPWTLLRD